MTRTHDFEGPAIPGRKFILWQGRDSCAMLRDYIKGIRVCRHPHHTASAPHALLGAVRIDALAGGVLKVSLGEILLAGSAALILEDLPEFKISAVKMIARAWRRGSVHLHASGSGTTVEIPIRCSIYATAEACPCGMLLCDRGPGPPGCSCSPQVLERWRARIAAAVELFQGRE